MKQMLWTKGALLAALMMVVPACCSSGRASPPDLPPEGPPPEDTPAAIEARVEAMLSGFERVPTADDWARAGTPQEVSTALMHIASQPQGRTLLAARALSSLAHFPRTEVARFLEARIADAKLRASLRGKAAIALAAGFGDAKADRVIPLLAEPDASLREDAIRAFRHFVSPSAERFLEARQVNEPDPRLQRVMAGTRSHIAERRAARIGAKTYPAELDRLPALTDPGPVRAPRSP